MARLKVFQPDSFSESNMPEEDIILIIEAWSAADCDSDHVAKEFNSKNSKKSRISQFNLRMNDTKGAPFTLEGVQAETEALLNDILDLRRNNTDKPPIIFYAQGFGGIILKQALSILSGSSCIEEHNGLFEGIQTAVFICSIHRWEDEQALKSSISQILTAQHTLDNATALDHSQTLSKVVTDVNSTFYESKAMFMCSFTSIVPSESAFPEATIYRRMGCIWHPLEIILETSAPYGKILNVLARYPLPISRPVSENPTTQIFDRYLSATLDYAPPQYPYPQFTDESLEDESGQSWITWTRNVGTSFKLARRNNAARKITDLDAAEYGSDPHVSNLSGFVFDLSPSAAHYGSLSVFLWTWLSQLLFRFKLRLSRSDNSTLVTPEEFSQHLDVVGETYSLKDDDLFLMCVCTFKESLRMDRRSITLLVLENVDPNVQWHVSLAKMLLDVFQGSQLLLKVLITSPQIDVVRTSLSIAPQRSLQGGKQESLATPKPSGLDCKTTEMESADSVAWHIAEKYHPPIRKMRLAVTGFSPWLRSVIHRRLQDDADYAYIRGMVDEILSCPTEQSAIRAILNSLSVNEPLLRSAITIILWCTQPLKKAEFELLLDVAMASPAKLKKVTYEEVESLFHGLVIVLRGRVLLANDMVREALQLHGVATGVKWCREETQSHLDLADWCLDYLHLPENQDILTKITERDGASGRDTRHGLLWYAVDHWAEHARRSKGCWRPEWKSFQNLLAYEGERLKLWAVAKSKQQPPLPSLAAGPRTALSILAQHGLQSAVEIVVDLTRGQDTFGDELADAFIAASSSGHLGTVHVLARQAELHWFDVGQAVLAAIESGVEGILVEVIHHTERLGLEFGDPSTYFARAASLNNMAAVQVVQDRILNHKPLEEISKSSFPLRLACYTSKPDMLLAMLAVGISPTPGDMEGWWQPMETVCRYGSSALVEPLLEHFKLLHALEKRLWTILCQKSLRKADEYGECAVTSSILNWASRNSLILLDDSIIQLSASFWSSIEHTKLLTSHLTQPEIFDQRDTQFYKAVLAFCSKGAIEAAQELLRPPMTVNEEIFCTLLGTADEYEREKLIRLICSVGARSGIDMRHPAVQERILADNFIQNSINDGSIATLLEYKLDPNMEIPSLGRSMLGYAAYKGKIDAVRALLAAGAKVDAGGDDWTPLHCAYDNPDITALLLENGADVDIRDSAKRSALYFASKWGNVGVVSAILEKKPSRDTLEQALGSALGNSQTEVAKVLTGHDADLTVESSDAVDWLANAVRASNAALVHLILDCCRRLNINYGSGGRWSRAALHWIDQSTDPSIVRTLVTRGADVNVADWCKANPLFHAAAADNIGVARCLVRRGAEVNGSKNQPLALGEACKSASPEFVKFLLDEGADVNAVCYAHPGTALHAALLRSEDDSEDAMRKAQILDYLLDMNGIDVRIRSHSWGSVLNVAALNCQPAIVTRLLKMGVTANDVDHLGREPIHFALMQSVEMAQLLLREKGVTLDGKDKLGRHALHFAVQSQRPDVVEFVLCERPLLVNEPDIHGWTPLLWAIRPPPEFCTPATEDCLRDILKLLLEKGASKFVRGGGAGGEIWTPVRLASYCNQNTDVLDLLRPSEEELEQCKGNDRDIWIEAANRRGKLRTGAYCDICLATAIGIDYDCGEVNCAVAAFFMCWKCALSQELLHPGSSHVLSASGEETEMTQGSATSSGEASQNMEDDGVKEDVVGEDGNDGDDGDDGEGDDDDDEGGEEDEETEGEGW